MNVVERYVKENNIKQYLIDDLDIDNILKLMTQEDFDDLEETIFEDNYENIEQSYVSNLIQAYNYNLACENNDIEYLLDMIYGCEFDLEITEDGKLNLVDMQGVYLGGVDSYEEFEDILYACDRLSGAYFQDYYNLYL